MPHTKAQLAQPGVAVLLPRRIWKDLARVGLGVLFVAAAVLYSIFYGSTQPSPILLMAVAIGGYMAMNIGANDVANNVGPAVGSKALTMGSALLIAAIFEAAGALIAGGEVVGTIRSGIIYPDSIRDPNVFVWVMLAALLAGALWLNIATAVGAPVSTTHSIVGAVLGAGIAAAGTQIVNWPTMGGIAASWVISPVLGALFAAAFLYLIKRSITYQQDMSEAARRMVPLLIGFMVAIFTAYLILKGLNKVWTVGFYAAMLYGLIAGVAVFLFVRRRLAQRGDLSANTKQSVNQLFNVPLVFAAALLSFAHGSNDVANAIGPLAAIVDVVSGGVITKSAPIPPWVMMLGALGISVGLALFGPKVIRTVGSEITELDQMRAYCIAMGATITVIVASQLGLPVSSTHIAVGGVFGVGFLREYLKTNYDLMLAEIHAHHHATGDTEAVDAFIREFESASIEEKGVMLRELKERAKTAATPGPVSKGERKELKKLHKRELVKRSQVIRIAAAWVITVPASAFMAAMLYFTIRGMMLP